MMEECNKCGEIHSVDGLIDGGCMNCMCPYDNTLEGVLQHAIDLFEGDKEFAEQWLNTVLSPLNFKAPYEVTAEKAHELMYRLELEYLLDK